jgi:hypothetical protein
MTSTFDETQESGGTGDEPRLRLTGQSWMGAVEVVTAPIAATRAV